MRLIALLLTVTVVWAAPPQRIVSTAPSVTETLFGMGLGARVVGVTVFDKFPPEVVKLPKVGTYLKPDVEAIVALKPDLVVVQQLKTRLAEHLALLHLPYIEVQSDNLSAVYDGARAMGKATGESAAAEHLVSTIQGKLAGLAAQSAQYPSRPTAIFLVGHTPGRLEGLIAGAGGSYFADLLKAAGATNALADSIAAYPKVSLEEILSRNPDFLFEMSGDSPDSQAEVVSLWQSHTSLKAVAQHHVFAIPSGPFVIPGPRAPEAAGILFDLLHPNAGHAP